MASLICSQDACSFTSSPSPQSLQHLQDLPSPPPLLSILVATMQVSPRLPLPFLLGSDRLPALPLHYFPPKMFLPLAHQPICTVWAAPQACCSQARLSKCGQLLAHLCCFFSDQISPGSAVAKDNVDMSWTQWPSISHRCENRMLVLVQGLLYSSSASAVGASLDADTGHSSPRCCGVTAYGGLGLRQWL